MYGVELPRSGILLALHSIFLIRHSWDCRLPFLLRSNIPYVPSMFELYYFICESNVAVGMLLQYQREASA